MTIAPRLAPTILALATMAGCATQTQPQGPTPHSAALEDLPAQSTPTANNPEQETLAQAARRSADDLTALLTEGRPLRPRINPDPPEGNQHPWQSPDQAAPPPQDQQPLAQADPSPPSEQDTEPEPEPEPPPDPLPALLAQLEAQAREPQQALAATILAQALRAYARTRDGSRPGQDLSPPEQQLVAAMEPVIEALVAADRADAPTRIAQAMDQAALALADALPVRIHHAALATDIFGYAAYRPFEANRFLAGRTNCMLVYTEPIHFQTRPSAEPKSAGDTAAHPGSHEVVLGLELRLFNEMGSMLAWRRPEERVVIRSDRPRREVYLGTLVELPATLTVGRYQLKIILKDHADGSTDERVIPIEIVADPRLTTNPTRRP